MSKNRIYYGEYTLRHWLDLLLNKNIVLPNYQRTFVWNKNKVQKFFDSIYHDYFIPPITLGFDSRNSQNLIIDGQQRLTSLLLGCLQLFPKQEKNNLSEPNSFANFNDDEEDEESIPVLAWTFNKLLKDNTDNTIESIRKENKVEKNSKYEVLKIDYTIDDIFLETHYLGFSYLVPDEDGAVKFFSNTFKIINTSATSLTPLESRQSMYYMADGMEAFFDPEFCKKLLIYNGSKPERIDFVRYLSFAFQYKCARNFDCIAKNFSRGRIEEYYADFILSVVNNEKDEKFAKCSDENKNQIDNLRKAIDGIGANRLRFSSIIDADMYLFGLIYYIIVEKRQIDLKQESLYSDIEKTIEKFKKNEKHKKSPAALKYLRIRLESSKKIYEKVLL